MLQVISGLGREIPSPSGKPIPGAIQTDAPINAGALHTFCAYITCMMGYLISIP